MVPGSPSFKIDSHTPIFSYRAVLSLLNECQVLPTCTRGSGKYYFTTCVPLIPTSFLKTCFFWRVLQDQLLENVSPAPVPAKPSRLPKISKWCRWKLYSTEPQSHPHSWKSPRNSHQPEPNTPHLLTFSQSLGKLSPHKKEKNKVQNRRRQPTAPISMVIFKFD